MNPFSLISYSYKIITKIKYLKFFVFYYKSCQGFVTNKVFHVTIESSERGEG